MDDLVPQRSYAELIAISTRRGRALRRRRHALQATGPVLTAVVLLAGPWSPAHSGTDSLREVPATRPSQVAPLGPEGLPRPNSAVVGTTAGSAAAGPSAAGGTGADATRPRSGPAVHFSLQGRIGTNRAVSFGDARGDGVVGLSGTGQDGSASAASADGVDIVGMRFESTPDGLRVTMTLAGPHRSDSTYYADLTDSVTGCRLRLELGGTEPDGFVDECTDQRLHNTPEVVDPSLDVLVAQVPWSLFPTDVAPGHVFTDLDGVSLQGLATGYSQADVATTSARLGPLR